MINFSQDMRQGIYSLGILFLMVFGFYVALIQPAISARSRNAEQIENLIYQSSRFTLSSQKNLLMKNEIKKLKNQSPSVKGFLDDKAPAIVAADLQKHIKIMVESSGGSLVSTHALPLNEDELFPKVTVKVHLRTDVNSLRDVFYQIAINKPLLFTDNILIQKRHIGNRNRRQTDNQIDVRFDVSGYMNPS